jgi:two-component system alkaline phosphatase synthesis response regulator PhoP
MKTILIADDEEDVRMLVYITLASPRYCILETGDGKSALEIARRERPDLLVLDRMMPNMNGLDVAEVLRKDPFTAGIPIIMLTAIHEEADKKLTRNMGVFAYMVKPFSPLELQEKVRIMIE